VDEVRKVERSSFSDSAKSQTRDFVFNPTVNRKPMLRLEMRRDVFRFANSQDQTRSIVLKFLDCSKGTVDSHREENYSNQFEIRCDGDLHFPCHSKPGESNSL
jgi:hypothetical protein